MKSKKDQGNVFFKKQKYKEAVQCYNEYVKVDHQDNSKAYSNMALCYFKISQYANCVSACQMAVELEPQFQKPFYRMYQAYRQLKDYYGMVISAQKFCKLTKDQKDLQAVQKELIKVKQDLSYKYYLNNDPTFEDETIKQVIKLTHESKDNQKSQKEPQTSLQSRWQRIEQVIKKNNQQGLNLARRFLNVDCKNEEEKDNYKKLLLKLKKTIITNVSDPFQNNHQKSESSQEIPKVEELEKYVQSIQQTKNQSKKEQISQQTKKLQTNTQNLVINADNIQKNPTQSKQNNISGEDIPNQTNLNQQTESKWKEYINQDQAQKLLQKHINSKLSKAEDLFVTFYQAVCDIAASKQLDKFQKQAILSITPIKVKKFNILIKSYSSKQKQHFKQLFNQFTHVKLWKNVL